jgi:glucose dehydrogenase
LLAANLKGHGRSVEAVDAQRYSPLDKINKGTVKDLKLAYAVAIGGTSANENLEATPLAEDGFLYSSGPGLMDPTRT